jgi:multicomponent Na+:H+ antiporter subunit E
VIKVFHVAWLVVVWLLLWSDTSWANLLSGLAVAVTVAAVYGTWRAGAIVVRPIKALKLLVVFMVGLVEASFVVARTIVTPRIEIRSGIFAVPLGDYSDALVTLIADLNSLTPGTLTLNVRRQPTVLYMHALHIGDVEATRHAARRLELLVVEAFGDDAALAALHDVRAHTLEAER